MSTLQGSLSSQTFRHLPEGELILQGGGNEEITPIVAEVFYGKLLRIPTLCAVWLGGMVITIIVVAAGYVRILRRLRNTEPTEDALSEPWENLLIEHGIDPRTVPMLLSYKSSIRSLIMRRTGWTNWRSNVAVGKRLPARAGKFRHLPQFSVLTRKRPDAFCCPTIHFRL